MSRGKAIATAVIIILLLAILGVVIYGSMTIESSKEVGSGEPIISGNISSGEEVPPTVDGPQPEEPIEELYSATVSLSGITYADTVDEVNTTTYRQVVFNRSNAVRPSEGLYVATWMNDVSDISYTSMEYILEYHYSTYVGASPSDTGYGTYIYSGNSSFNLMFGSRRGLSDIEKYITFGDYDGNEYAYSYSVIEGSANDYLYFTMTMESAFLSYFLDGGSTTGNNSYYEESLNHILFKFDKGSPEYRYLSSLGGVALNANYDESNADLKETLACYKDMDVPVKDGYTFVGWYYDEEFTRPYQGEAIESDVKLYAKYEINRYVVTFDGSELDDPNDPNNVGIHSKVEEVEYGTVLDYTPEPVEGKVFLGWYLEDGTKYDNTPVKSDLTLIGKWRQSMCTLTFDFNGHEGALEPIEVEYGSKVKLPLPTSGDYRVMSWEDLDVPSWNEDIPVTSDLHLIAYWEKYIFTVTFYVDEEIWKEVKVEKGNTLGSVVLTENVDSKSVVGFENMHTETVATNFAEFEVKDDIAVYLSEASNTDTPIGDGNGTTLTWWQTFWNNVKAFFEKIGQWFKNLFSKFKK